MPTVAADEETDNDYRLGGGYAVGDSGWRLGGYASAKFILPRKNTFTFDVSDLSLFLTWDNNSRLRFFAELEGGDALTADEKHSPGTRDAHFEFERFYLDGLINSHLTVRLGKFLTPIGQWNVIHADPLVWTTYRPVATENLFSLHATGVMLHGLLSVADRPLEYALYGDLTNSLDPQRSSNPFKQALGLHLRYALTDHLQIGSSAAHFVLNDRHANGYYLAGLDLVWSYQKFEISSEWVYRVDDSNAAKHWQGFLQSVAPLDSHWFLIGRYEFFEQAKNEPGQVGVLGLAYRPLPPLVWKLEYRLGTHNDTLAPDGLAASFAVLF